MRDESSLRVVPLVWLVACTIAAGGCSDHDEGDAGPRPGEDGGDSSGLVRPLDDVLRLNQIQALATHNSYHVESPDNGIAAWAFTRDPLDVQFEEQGVRAVELDTNFDLASGEPRVFHVPTIDAESTCPTLADCLSVIRTWSDANPGHHTLFVHLEPKDDSYGATFEFGPYVDAVEEVILGVLGRERIVTPDDVQGEAATLRDAIMTRGWPTLGDTRDKVLFYLNEMGKFSEALTAGGTALSGRLIFPEMTSDHPLAAVIIANDPFSDIPSLVNQGFIVRTRADNESQADAAQQAQALSSGAQLVTTDYPVASGDIPAFSIPGGTPSRCNPLTAPADCTSTDIEAL